MKTNLKPDTLKTHEGATAKHISYELQLKRAVLSTLLWEDTFYEDGVSIANRIKDLISKVSPEFSSNLALEARSRFNLRHTPLWMIVCLLEHLNANKGHKVRLSTTIEGVIQRTDELSELLSLYWKTGRKPLPNQLKVGLAKAFTKFDAYQLAKYDREEKIKLKDVMFLTHPKPKDETQAEIWKKLIDGTLESPDTWEVSLSAGKDKKEVFERLILEKKLGGLALLRNLRQMEKVGVDTEIIRAVLKTMKTDRIFPYRFITAATQAPHFEPELEEAMFKCLSCYEKIQGETILLIDVSGSMEAKISKSDASRIDVACGLAILLREICQRVKVLTFSSEVVEAPPRRGFALRDAILRSQAHNSTLLGGAMKVVNALPIDRLIVFTDEQSQDTVPDPKPPRSYLLNVASNKNGIGYGKWTHIDGFSDSVVKFITEYEKEFNFSPEQE